MKTKLTPAAYESPKTDVITFNPEGVLCESNVKSNHNPFQDGGDLDFSDWSN